MPDNLQKATDPPASPPTQAERSFHWKRIVSPPSSTSNISTNADSSDTNYEFGIILIETSDK